MDKKEAAAKMMNQEQKEAIRELQEAVERYNRNSSDKTYGEVLFAFFMAAKNAKAAFARSNPLKAMDLCREKLRQQAG